MKTLILLLVATILPIFAWSSEIQQTLPEADSSQFNRTGLKVEFIVQSLKKGNWQASNNFASSTDTEFAIKEDFGIAIGYQNIATSSYGFVTRLKHTQHYEELKSLRLEAGVGYGLTNRVALSGGLNLTKYTEAKNYDKAAPGLGFQVAGSYHLSENVDLSMMFVQTGNDYKSGSTEVEFGDFGLELSLGYIF